MIGTSVGPYRLVRKLGAGGMGEVYLAEDTRLQRKVALKSLAASLIGSPDARERLLREARAAAKLNHPNIAGIYDVIDAPDRAYIVMEYVEGETLAGHLKWGRLTREQVLDAAIQLADALVEAHGRGVIHRDLKPSNIHLTPEGKVKVVDFGLAKLHEMPAPDVGHVDTSASQPGRIVGTPAYMAPEQLLGRPADHRSDIYSTGALLFELLTGRLPFGATSYVDLTLTVLTKPAPTPIDIDPAVPRELSDIVARAMAPDPADRYQSAAHLRADLKRVADTLTEARTVSADAAWPVRADVTSLLQQAARRRRAMAIGTTVAIAVVGLASGIAYRQWGRTEAFRERDWVLVADFENRTGNPDFDNTVREALVTGLQQSRYVNVLPRAQVFDALRRMRRADAGRVDEALGLDLCQRENVKVLLAGSILRSGEAFQITVQALDTQARALLFVETAPPFEQEKQLFDRVDWLARRVRERLGESLGRIQSSPPLAKVTTSSLEALQVYSRALDAIAQGRVDAARTQLQSAIALDADFAMAHLRLARVYATLGHFQSALEHYQHAYRLRSQVTEREQYLIAGGYYTTRYEYDKAVETLRVLTSLYPDDLDAHSMLQDALYNAGNLEEAVGEIRQVLRLQPFAATPHSNLVLYLAALNQNDQAVEAYEQAVRQGARTPYLYWGLGLARLGQGKTEEARDAFRQLAQAGGVEGSLGQLCLTSVNTYEGHFEAAIEQLNAGISLDQRLGNTAYELVRRYLLGRVFLLRGDTAGARREADLLLGAGEADLTARNLYRAGVLHLWAGEIGRAKATLRKLQALRDAVPVAINRTYWADLQAEIALAEGRTESATESFVAATAGYPRHESHQGLARAHQKRGAWRAAVSEWQQVLAARGNILQTGFAADWVLAHLELARCQVQLNDRTAARRSYEEFLRIWQGADDVLLRREALREYQQLTGQSPDAPGTQLR